VARIVHGSQPASQNKPMQTDGRFAAGADRLGVRVRSSQTSSHLKESQCPSHGFSGPRL
jgi:hypothetical protein